MRAQDNGSFYSVSVSASELREFATRWPCSGMRYATRGIWFQFEKSNGDLVDIEGDQRKGYDEGAVSALSQDAQAFGARRLQCINCGAWPEGHCTTRTRPVNHLCDACAAILEALTIGDPRTARTLLYDDGKGHAVNWTGAVLGTISHKLGPQDNRRFLAAYSHPPRSGMRGAVRYRVKMLDGSRWWGRGPTDNGNYIRLRRAK